MEAVSTSPCPSLSAGKSKVILAALTVTGDRGGGRALALWNLACTFFRCPFHSEGILTFTQGHFSSPLVPALHFISTNLSSRAGWPRVVRQTPPCA